jgi:hypothetical protein
MGSQQMMELLLAMREDMKAEREQRKAKREADQEQRKRVMEEMLAKMDANLAKSNTHNEMITAYLGKTDATDLKANPEERQSVGEHQEVLKEEAAIMPVGEPRKRRRNRNLAVERRQKPKERTRGYCGSRNRVTIADRKVSLRAAVAWRRRDIFAQERTRVKRGSLEQLVAAHRVATLHAKLAGRETSKRRKFGRKRQLKQEGRNGVKDLGGGWP